MASERKIAPMQTTLPEFVGDIILEYLVREYHTYLYNVDAIDVLDLANQRVKAAGEKVTDAFWTRRDAGLNPFMVPDCTPNTVEKLQHVLGDIDAMDRSRLNINIPLPIARTCQAVLLLEEATGDLLEQEDRSESNLLPEDLCTLEKALCHLMCVTGVDIGYTQRWKFTEYPISSTRSIIYAALPYTWQMLYYRKRDSVRLIGISYDEGPFECMFGAKKTDPYCQQLLNKMRSREWFDRKSLQAVTLSEFQIQETTHACDSESEPDPELVH